ncbi:butyrophilin-like protein 3 [Silurus asotus]|uniref:Butyrophilin-like protein 3 n=1 Tax=Silurus asotus TaxID=30991 RepID=A0AAD5B876_SILAS|nr:butyrophilin-like protein 3 [Silurus asotus]
MKQLQVVGPADPLVAVAGEDLILPCFTKSNTSAVDMRVEWFRLNVEDSLVHLYMDHEDRNENQALLYSKRTSLFKEELQKGNASLKLSALRVSDDGKYKCLIEDKSQSDDITVNVIVEVQGSQPVIMMENYDNSGGIHLVCESRGWNPEPEILWLNREGDTLPAEDTQIHRDTEGFSVKRSITVYDYSDSNRFYCRVLQKHHMMETEMIINMKLQVVGPAAPLVAVAGEDLVLPCFIKPNTSAVDMTVEWLRLKEVASLVHHYENHEDIYDNQAQPYRGRTSLFKKELQKGNASLKLSDLRVSDEGKYKCLIEDKSWYDDITVYVTVEGLCLPFPRDDVMGFPARFSGDRAEWGGFIRSVCEYMDVSSSSYPTEADKIALHISLLSGKSLSLASELWSTSGGVFGSCTRFIRLLTRELGMVTADLHYLYRKHDSAPVFSDELRSAPGFPGERRSVPGPPGDFHPAPDPAPGPPRWLCSTPGPPRDLRPAPGPSGWLHSAQGLQEILSLLQDLRESVPLPQDLQESVAPPQDLQESSAPLQDLLERTASLQGFRDSSFPL